MRNFIKEYKGHDILDVDGLITVHKDGSDFIVALDDSKSSGPKFIDQNNNTVECAQEYIDWKESACRKNTSPTPSS